MFAMRQSSPARVDVCSVSMVSRMSADQVDERPLALHFLRRTVGFRHGDLAQDSTRRRGEHVHAVAEIDGFFDGMRHEEHRCLRFLPQLVEQLLHAEPRGRIERAERLVHQDDARPEDQRARDRHALAHAAGELARILVSVALDVEADLVDPRVGLFAPLARANAAALEAERDVVFDGAIVERRVVLEHHAAIRAGPGHRSVGHVHDALGGRVVRRQARDETEDRGLPAAGRSEDGHELALARQIGHGEGDIPNHGEVAESLGDAAKLDDVRQCRHSWPRGRETDRAGKSTASGRWRRPAAR